ncbi:MAG TPA: hypothetical protein VMU56_06165 [Beijerinckiaceae bacterium]|nr:hypothetical protein [Beijerinckiaceae bacterium]
MLETARDCLNGVDLVAFSTFSGMKIVDRSLRMQALHVGLSLMPTDWAKLFSKPQTGTFSSSIYLDKFKQAMRRLMKLEGVAEREGDDVRSRMIFDCIKKSLFSACQNCNIFDLTQLLDFIGNLKERERYPEAFDLLLNRAPLELERLLQTSYEEFTESWVEEGGYDLLVASFNQLAALRSAIAPNTRKAGDSCLYKMWVVACKEMAPGELARFVDKVSGNSFRMSSARLFLLTDVVAPLLEDVIDTVRSLGEAPETATVAAEFFVEAYRMAHVLLARDAELMLNAPSLSSQRKLVARCFNVLTSEGKQAALERLSRGEIRELRELIIMNQTSVERAAEDLYRIGKHLGEGDRGKSSSH